MSRVARVVNRFKVILVLTCVVTYEAKKLGDIAAPAASLNVEQELDGIADVAANCPVRQLDPRLQDAAGKSSYRLFRRVGMNGGNRAGMAGVKGLQKIEGFA